MNNQIEELAKQAVININYPLVDSTDTIISDNWEETISLEKFADLIIKECMMCVKEVVIPITADTIEEKIKKYFGVE